MQVVQTSSHQTAIYVSLGATRGGFHGVRRHGEFQRYLLMILNFLASLKADLPGNASREDVSPFITALSYLTKERPFRILLQNVVLDRKSPEHQIKNLKYCMNETSSNQGTVNPGGFVSFCVSNIFLIRA